MSKTTVRRIAALIVSVAGAAGLSSCSFQDVAGTGGCGFNIQYVHNRTSNGAVINVKATLKCNIDITQARATLKMQRNIGGRWVDVPYSARSTYLGYVSANSKNGAFFESNDVRCVNGLYRGAARGGAYFNGRYSGSSAWGYGPANEVVCR